MTDSQHEQDMFSNRRYKIALTTAALLFLALITITILMIIIASAREDDLQTQFDSTLTAIYTDMQPSYAALSTPPAAYALRPAPGAPVYSAAESCDLQIVTGTILDSSGDPTDAYTVHIWGDTLPHQVLSTGVLARLDPGQWAITLDNATTRRVYVQLAEEDRYVSAPVEIALSAADCAQNITQIDFTQIAPAEQPSGS